MVHNLLAMPGSVAGEAALYDRNMLALARRTVAKDCNADEFDLFITMCRRLKLDPLRRQAYAFVSRASGKAGQPEQRRLKLIVSITGFRTIADRTGCYRPDEEAAKLVYDRKLKDPATNPLGLVKAVVRVHKFAHGEWHKVTAEAFWDEYAPIREEWAQDEAGTRKLTGRHLLDSSGYWAKMPRVMLAKVAEAAALRKAFPDELSDVHEDAELDRAKLLDVSPTEAAEQCEVELRRERLGGSSGLMVDWSLDGTAPIEAMPLGLFADRVTTFLDEHADEPSKIAAWQSKNRHALKEFWARAPSDALAVKKMIEARLPSNLSVAKRSGSA